MPPDVAIADAARDFAEDNARRHHHPAWATLRRLLHHRLFVTGLVLFGIVALAAILAPWIAPVDPDRLAMRFRFLPPSPEHLFGTDNFGRSLWSRVIWGARLSMVIGSAVVAINAVFGTADRRGGRVFPRARQRGDADQRRADGVSGGAAGDRRHRRAGAVGERRDHRAGHRLYAAHRAHRARLGDRAARDGLCAGGARRRGRRSAHPAQAHPAECHGAADRAAFVPVRLRGADRGDACLSSASARCRRRRPGATSWRRAANTWWMRRGSSPFRAPR